MGDFVLLGQGFADENSIQHVFCVNLCGTETFSFFNQAL